MASSQSEEIEVATVVTKIVSGVFGISLSSNLAYHVVHPHSQTLYAPGPGPSLIVGRALPDLSGRRGFSLYHEKREPVPKE